MYIDQELLQKLEYAWLDQSFGINWASKELSKYAYAACNGATVIVENYDQKIDSAQSFLNWKRKHNIFAQIPLFRQWDGLSELLNTIVKELEIDNLQIVQKPASIPNPYYLFKLTGNKGDFTIYAHKLINMEQPSRIIKNIIGLQFQAFDNHYKLTCSFYKDPSLKEMTSLQMEFTNLEIM